MGANFQNLIGGIVFVVFGTIISIFWKKVGDAMASSSNEFWKKLGMSEAPAWGNNISFNRIFILIIGTIFLLFGLYSIYRFFRA